MHAQCLRSPAAIMLLMFGVCPIVAESPLPLYDASTINLTEHDILTELCWPFPTEHWLHVQQLVVQGLLENAEFHGRSVNPSVDLVGFEDPSLVFMELKAHGYLQNVEGEWRVVGKPCCGCWGFQLGASSRFIPFLPLINSLMLRAHRKHIPVQPSYFSFLVNEVDRVALFEELQHSGFLVEIELYGFFVIDPMNFKRWDQCYDLHASCSAKLNGSPTSTEEGIFPLTLLEVCQGLLGVETVHFVLACITVTMLISKLSGKPSDTPLLPVANQLN